MSNNIVLLLSLLALVCNQTLSGITIRAKGLGKDTNYDFGSLVNNFRPIDSVNITKNDDGSLTIGHDGNFDDTSPPPLFNNLPTGITEVTNEPENDLSTFYGDDFTPVQQVDTDDDVPMLTNIYERLEEIRKEQADQARTISRRISATQGKLDLNGSDSNATLSDIVQAIQYLYDLDNNQSYDLNSSNPLLDSDNDVPLLTEIKYKIEEFKDENNDNFELVNEQFGLLRGRLMDENGTLSDKNATLADIVHAIRGDQDYNATKTKEESDKESALVSGITSFASGISDAIPDDPNTYLDTMFEMDAGSWNFYLDPLNGTVSGFDFPFTFQDIADWISLLIVFYCLIRYWHASLENVDEMLTLVTVAPKTAPASSFLQIKVKIALIASLVVTVIFGGIIGLLESNFSVLGTSGTILEVIAGVGKLIVIDGWGMMAISLFFDLFPAFTILYLVSGYWIQKLALKVTIFVGFSFVQKAS